MKRFKYTLIALSVIGLRITFGQNEKSCLDVFPCEISANSFEQKNTKRIKNNFDRFKILRKKKVKAIIVDSNFLGDLKISKFSNLEALWINGKNNVLAGLVNSGINIPAEHFELYGEIGLPIKDIISRDNLVTYVSFYHYPNKIKINRLLDKSRLSAKGIWLEGDCIDLDKLNTLRLKNAVFVADSIVNIDSSSFQNLKLSTLELECNSFGEINESLFLALNSVESIRWLRIGNDNIKLLHQTFIKLEDKDFSHITLTIPNINSSNVNYACDLLNLYKERITIQVLKFNEKEIQKINKSCQALITRGDLLTELNYLKNE